jgi:predicted DNA-binding transcriptional regulator AlpA
MNATNPLSVIPAYLRQKKAATYVGLSEQMLIKLVRKNEGPPRIRKGRAVLYSVKALDEWMERDQEEPLG